MVLFAIDALGVYAKVGITVCGLMIIVPCAIVFLLCLWFMFAVPLGLA